MLEPSSSPQQTCPTRTEIGLTMERLTAEDASFLRIEDQTSAMHGMTVAVFEGPEPRFDELLGRMARKIVGITAHNAFKCQAIECRLCLGLRYRLDRR